MPLIHRASGRRSTYPMLRDIAPEGVVLRAGRRGRAARTQQRCFPQPQSGTFSAQLPGSLCVEFTKLTKADLPPELRAFALRSLATPQGTEQLARALQRAYFPAEREWFLVLVLDSRNRMIGWYTAAVGGARSVQVEIPLVLRGVIAAGAVGFLVVHNHPSGSAEPSREDWSLTDRLGAAAELCGLSLLDHLVIGEASYTSMREIGHMD